MPDTYTLDDVATALNRAADDILTAMEARVEFGSQLDEGLRDALNLVVNAAGAYLEGTASTLAEVAEVNYDSPLDEILGWVAQAVR
jgi:hypothetical protein